jgi:hypothetical protein
MTDPIDRAPFYHDGMRELQDHFDGRRAWKNIACTSSSGSRTRS